ncbi:MAG: hypothetical protein R3D62_08155 [Xanthobacteraceae bacterium]
MSPRWTWGWDGVLVSGPDLLRRLQDLFLQSRSADLVSFFGQTEDLATVPGGARDRSYFDARTIHYTGFTSADQQDALPIIHPVVDYQNTFDQPLLGGEFGYNINMTSLSRDAASFDAISQAAVTNNLCNTTSADPALKTSANCLLRGVPGNYSRLSGDVHWRSRFIDPLGQVFTPSSRCAATSPRST